MKRKVLLLSAGIAAGLLYTLESNRRKSRIAAGNDSGALTDRPASMATIEDGKATVLESTDYRPIDDQDTTQAEASHILKEIRDRAFDASNERLALALGRSTEEIDQWTSGDGLIDGDALMKARALAIQRDVEVQ